IQIKKKNNGIWEKLYPVSLNENIFNNEGINLTDQLNKKSDLEYVNTELEKKADQEYVNTELEKKADQSYVTERFDQTLKLIYPAGTSEDTTMLNDVLSSGGRFLIKKGIYKIDDNVELVSNTYLEFEQGAEFHKIAQTSDHYRIIDIDNCDNVELVNP